MATLSEHAELIKAAIKAAQDDGFTFDTDLSYDHEGFVDVVELDLWDGDDYINVYTEER